MPVTNKRSLQTQIWPRGSQRLSTGLEKFHCNVTLKATLLGKTIFHLHRAPPLPLPPVQSLEQTQREQSPLPPGHPFHPFAKASSALCPGAPVPAHLAPSTYPGEPAAADGTITERNSKPRIQIHPQRTAQRDSGKQREPRLPRAWRTSRAHPPLQSSGRKARTLRQAHGVSPTSFRLQPQQYFLCPFAPVH